MLKEPAYRGSAAREQEREGGIERGGWMRIGKSEGRVRAKQTKE